MTAKEHFDSPFTATPQAWELQPFVATAKREFGLFPEGSQILVIFKPGETIERCIFGRREFADKSKWVVRFSKADLPFQVEAPDFFKIFDA